MFGWFEKPLEAALNVGESLTNFEAPDRRDVIRLADAGLSIAAISAATGLSVGLIEDILEE